MYCEADANLKKFEHFHSRWAVQSILQEIFHGMLHEKQQLANRPNLQ